MTYAARYLPSAAELDGWVDRLFGFSEELRAGMLTTSNPDAVTRADAARELLELLCGDVEDAARRAGIVPGALAEDTDPVARGPNLRTHIREMLTHLRELLAAIESGELPAGPAYRHRVEGAITALEALLTLPPSLAELPQPGPTDDLS